MKCLVTGGCGFIGSHLVDLLLTQGHEVCILDDLSTGNLENVEKALKRKQCYFIEGNINDINQFEARIKHVDWIFHIAGRADLVPSIENPGEYFKVNVEGTLKLLEFARRTDVKRFIYAASSSCYGIPTVFPTPETYPCQVEHPYALTKYLGEQMVMHWYQVYKLPTVSLRLFNVYGPRSRTTGAYGAVFGVFLKQKLAGNPFTVVGDGTQTRDFTYVSDVTRAFYRAAESEISGRYFNVGSGKAYSINELVTLLNGEVENIPKRPGEPDCTQADISKIKEELRWEAEISFERGVKCMLENIDFWNEAPLWTKESIAEATKTWFSHLNPTPILCPQS